MQKYETVSKLSSIEFRRLTGVQKTTFKEMIAVVKEAENKRTSRRGKPPQNIETGEKDLDYDLI